MNDSELQSHWNEHVAWSETANRLKASRDRYRSLVLVLTVTGAVLATIASGSAESTARTTAGLLGAVSLAVVPFLTKYFLSAETTRNWLRARSISEGIKSEVYLYQAGAEPYTGALAAATLRKKVRTIRDWGKSLELERAKNEVSQKPGPPPLDATSYITSRVRQQIDRYYRPKARFFAKRSDQFRHAEIALAGFAAVVGAVATYSRELRMLGPWVAVITTVSGSIAAHGAAGRFDFQATTFYATARQLEDLVEDWTAAGKTAPGTEWSEFVHACEDAISAENRGWMAKLDENSGTAKAE